MTASAAVRRCLLVFVALAAGVAASVCCAAEPSAADRVAIDAFIAAQARRERGEEYRDARKIVIGNLREDAEAQTVVLYTIESQGGSNNYVQYLAVFVHQRRGLAALTHAEVGGKSVRAVELSGIEHGGIVLATLGYAPKDASCCPSVKGSTRYVLVGRILRETRDLPQS